MKAHSIRAALLVIGLAAVPPLFAAPAAVQRATELADQGQYKSALEKLDDYLRSSPQDAKGRFERGIILSKMGRTRDAIQVFAALTRDYPQLPEPYNNLAALYAQEGDYEKARAALEAALATHPSYAIAAENLGDVYAALAGAAYTRALMVDSGNSQIRYKLALINKLDENTGAAANSVAARQSPAKPAPTPEKPAAKPAPTQVASAEPPPAPEAKPESKPKPEPKPKAAPKTTTPKPASKTAFVPPPAPVAPVPEVNKQDLAEAAAAAPKPLSAAQQQTILKAVYGWADAWSTQNVKRYLSYYAPNFKVPGGLSRKDWEAQRRERVSAPRHISVNVEAPMISPMSHGRVRVAFEQKYASNLLSNDTNKALVLTRVGGHWKILEEKSL